MIVTLKAVNALMVSLGLDYGFVDYDQGKKAANVYWVGDAVETDANEDGSTAGFVTLDGWSINQGPMPIIEAREALRKALFVDKRVSDDDGTCVLSYGSSISVPSDVDGVYRIEITINYTEWSA